MDKYVMKMGPDFKWIDCGQLVIPNAVIKDAILLEQIYDLKLEIQLWIKNITKYIISRDDLDCIFYSGSKKIRKGWFYIAMQKPIDYDAVISIKKSSPENPKYNAEKIDVSQEESQL